MTTVVLGRDIAPHQRPSLAHVVRQSAVAVVCLGAAAAPLAGRAIPDDAARFAYGATLTVAFLAVALFVRSHPVLHAYWRLAFAWFVLSFVQVLNNTLPGFIGTAVLRDPPSAGNPLASSVSGSLVIQLLETILAIVPVVVFTKLSGADMRSIYARAGKRAWVISGVVFFVAFSIFVASIGLRPDSFAARMLPTAGPVSVNRMITFTPVLLVLVISNGFQEEFLFRGLFLRNYETFFGFAAANLLQAVVFAVAHAGISYTPAALLFNLLLTLPSGLLFGYVMRRSNGIITPAIVHAAADLPIYIAFLSYVT